MNEDNHNSAFNNTKVNNPEAEETNNSLDGTTGDASDEMTGETRKNSRLALYLAFLSLFFTALGITVGYKHWLRIHDKAKLALTEITVLKEQLSHTANNSKVEKLRASLAQSSDDAEQRLTNAIKELDQIRKQTTYSAKTVTDQIRELTLLQSINDRPNGHAINTTNTTQRTLQTEVRFLLESAKRSLHINHDKVSALQLLKAADQLLIQVASEELLSVREKIAQDIIQLEQFSLPNIADLSHLISQLEMDIEPLSALETTLAKGQKIDLFQVDDENSLTGKVKNYINDSVTISKQTESPRYALSLVDKQRTDQLLKLRLESLRLMLFKRHNTTYHQQIKTIKHMLDLYYSPVDTKPWLVTLEKLNEQNLVPSYPELSTALEQLILVSKPASPTALSMPTSTVSKGNEKDNE